MSEQLNDKRSASERLFSALSGVDEKYLAACEADKGVRKSGSIVVFMNKYGKAMAAVLCLALLGIGYFGVQHMGSFSDKGPSADSAVVNEIAKQECAVEEAPEAMDREEEAYEAAVGSVEHSEPGAVEQGAVTSNSTTSVSDKSDYLVGFNGTTSEAEKEVATEKKQHYREESADYIIQAQGMPWIGAYVPEVWPEEGAVMQLIADGGTFGNPVPTAWLFWSYDYLTDGFNVQVNGYQNCEEWMEQEIAEGDVVYEADYTREYVASRMQPVSGDAAGVSALEGELVEGYFGVLHETEEGYVLVRFNGVGTVDQIWEMMQ